MTRGRVARAWFALTAVLVLVGIVVQLFATADSTGGRFTGAEAVLNVFSFFTVQANLIVAATCLLLAVNPRRRSVLFRAARLDGVLAIAVTGVVFHIALKDLQTLTGAAAFADFVLHTASPVLCIAGWLLFGPRRQISREVIGWSLVFPVFWLAFTMLRGPIADFYPYPFLDVRDHGYRQVIGNCALVASLFLVLAAVAAFVDRVIGSRRAAVAQ